MTEELKNLENLENIDLTDQVEQAPEPAETEYESTLRFREEVVSKIVGFAVEEIEGILTMSGSFFSNLKESFGQSDKTKGVSVDMEETGVVVNLEMVLEYGKSAPQVFEQLKKLISERVSFMTGLKVLAMNVRVVDILTRDEFASRTRKKAHEEAVEVKSGSEPIEAELVEPQQTENWE